MFEGTIVPAVVDAAPEGGAWRVPSWGEIVARLAAADDLRHAMAHAEGSPAGNFARFGDRGKNPLERSQRLVNPDNLRRGKYRGGKILPLQMAWQPGDRETR